MDKQRPTADEKTEKKPKKRVILLDDLDGAEEDILGGAGQKLVFGESTSPLSANDNPFGGPIKGKR